MIFGIGTDICDVRRIAAAQLRHGDRFAQRVLGPAELLVWRARGQRCGWRRGVMAGRAPGLVDSMTGEALEPFVALDAAPHVHHPALAGEVRLRVREKHRHSVFYECFDDANMLLLI